MISWLSKILFYNILGWKFKGTIPDDKKIIAIMGPHTSAHDFIICVIGRSVLNMGNRIKFLGKAELFKNPLYKYFFTAFGGYPVDRSKKNNLVDSIVDIYNSKDEFFVTIAPEGTRKKVDKLKNDPVKKPIKTWSRKSTIIPDFVGFSFLIYNGKKFIPITVSEDMVGHKFGEFAPTRQFFGHTPADKKAKVEGRTKGEVKK